MVWMGYIWRDDGGDSLENGNGGKLIDGNRCSDAGCGDEVMSKDA